MLGDFTALLWLLKLGAVINVALIASTLALPTPDPHAVVPALVLLGVSAFRCLFPNRYLDDVVFHDTPLSSIFLTRLLATFSEVAYIYQFSYVIRVLNVGHVGWVDALSWVMVAQVVISQGLVWGAIGTRRLGLYFYEELGWVAIFVLCTVASARLYGAADALAEGRTLLQLNLLCALVYLPWQVVNLRALWARARRSEEGPEASPPLTRQLVASCLRRALYEHRRATDAESWGGLLGLSWMAGYWATLVPLWLYSVVRLAGTS